MEGNGLDRKATIKEFLLKNIIKGKKDITYDDSLINSGLVDSFGILELVFFIENTFGIRVEDYEILDAEADTINKIVALLNKK
ncbi:MAG: acyl carrier protein [Clostridiales bacterium]|jgi:acyl carrier protein|nr:acyl carrier protein [Clostridiales bacterium]